MVPLLVHLVFHPKSQSARELADRIHEALNSDPVVPGLNVPTRFTPEDGTTLPPTESGYFDDAEKVFVAVLADDYLAAPYAENLPSGRQNWGEWIGGLHERCLETGKGRCVPFQLSEYAWPLDERLGNVSFARVWTVAEEQQEDWVRQRLVIELIRFLQNLDPADAAHPQLTVQAFISYATRDLGQEAAVVEQLVDSLKTDQPVSPWMDAGKIPAGGDFRDEITKGIGESAILSVMTDAYGSREWCRKEVLLAKELMRPVVVVNALQTQEVRSFPYLGNVPVLRWDNNPQMATDLLLKETLRQLHSKQLLAGQKQDDETILTSAPELVTVVGQQGKKFLYPDPPLGEEETRLIEKAGVTIETPLQRSARSRFLEQVQIVGSFSESGDLERYGLGKVHLDEAAIEISRYLLLAGATLCYGGHLGAEGYTLALFELVRAHPISGIPPLKRVTNYVGWPLPISVRQRAQFAAVAAFRQMPRPSDLSEADAPEFIPKIETFFSDEQSPLHRFAWARGMTEMREAQTSEVQARVVLGGKVGPTVSAGPDGDRSKQWYRSRIPGVLEEVLTSLRHQQPVYLVGGFGGCARMIADVLQGGTREEMSWEFQKGAPHAAEMRSLYETRGLDWWSYEDMTRFLHQSGIAGLRNGLTEQENKELFETADIDRIVFLLLRGLQTLAL